MISGKDSKGEPSEPLVTEVPIRNVKGKGSISDQDVVKSMDEGTMDKEEGVEGEESDEEDAGEDVDVDSGTPCYTSQPYLSDLPPQGSDTKDMHFNSPLQVADLRTHGDFGRKSAENNRHGECNLTVAIFLHTL